MKATKPQQPSSPTTGSPVQRDKYRKPSEEFTKIKEYHAFEEPPAPTPDPAYFAALYHSEKWDLRFEALCNRIKQLDEYEHQSLKEISFMEKRMSDMVEIVRQLVYAPPPPPEAAEKSKRGAIKNSTSSSSSLLAAKKKKGEEEEVKEEPKEPTPEEEKKKQKQLKELMNAFQRKNLLAANAAQGGNSSSSSSLNTFNNNNSKDSKKRGEIPQQQQQQQQQDSSVSAPGMQATQNSRKLPTPPVISVSFVDNKSTTSQNQLQSQQNINNMHENESQKTSGGEVLVGKPADIEDETWKKMLHLREERMSLEQKLASAKNLLEATRDRTSLMRIMLEVANYSGDSARKIQDRLDPEKLKALKELKDLGPFASFGNTSAAAIASSGSGGGANAASNASFGGGGAAAGGAHEHNHHHQHQHQQHSGRHGGGGGTGRKKAGGATTVG